MSRSLTVILFLAGPVAAADPVAYPAPPKPAADEPVRKAWSPAKAASFLDAAAVGWTRDYSCVSCHTNMAFLMARPLMKGSDAATKEVRAFFEEEVAGWRQGRNEKEPAYYVATAAGLAFGDAVTGKLSADTKFAFEKVWAAQRKTGEWDWLKQNLPPLEHDDYYGAVLTAVAVGVAPEKYAASDAARPGVAKVTAFLTKTPAPDLHHRAMLLWASTKLGGLQTADDRAATVAALKKKQRADGGWCLPALGTYTRHTGAANDADGPSDGYATGFVTYVLREAGTPANDPAVAKAVGWLKANQRASGRWFTRSPSTDRRHLISNTGTAFAVLALAACGENVAAE